MNYGEMKARFSSLLNRRDCTTAQREAFLSDAHSRIGRDLRVPAMEKNLVVTIASGTNYNVSPNPGLAIPGDYLQLIKLHVYEVGGTYKGTLKKSDLGRVMLLARSTGAVPSEYAREGRFWVLGPEPGDGTLLRANYYGEPERMLSDADTNEFSSIAPDLYVYGALSYAADHFGDSRSAAWEGRYQEIKGALQDQANRDELSGEAGVQPAYSFDDGMD